MKVGYLYIVRHAECQNNVTKIILPPDEDVITEHGKQQANLLGTHLEDVKFTKVFSSDYARCVQTISHVLSQSKHSEVANLKIQYDERLRERNGGKFEGGPIKDVMMHLAEHIFVKGIAPAEVEFPGGDPSAVMHQRAASFFEEIFDIVDNSEECEPEIIAASSHGFAIMYLINHLTSSNDKIQLNNTTSVITKLPSNTAYIKLAIHKKADDSSLRQIDVLAEHDTSHLASLQKEDPIGSYAKGSKFEGCVHQ